MGFIDQGGREGAQAFPGAQQLLLAGGGRGGRGLRGACLPVGGRGRAPVRPPPAPPARFWGGCLFFPGGPFFPRGGGGARSAPSGRGRAAGGVLRPLTLVRQDEIVIVRALDGEDPRRLTEPVERSQRELAGAGVQPAIGVRTALETDAGLPDGYREEGAAMARSFPAAG